MRDFLVYWLLVTAAHIVAAAAFARWLIAQCRKQTVNVSLQIDARNAADSAAIVRAGDQLKTRIFQHVQQAWSGSCDSSQLHCKAAPPEQSIAPQHAPDAIPWLWEQIDNLKAKVDELKGDLVISDSRAQAALAHAEASNEAFVAIQHEQQRLIDALQDAITLLEGKPAKWAELAPDYGIDPKVFTPESLKQAVIAEYRTLILEVTTPTIDASAPAAEATAEASAS